MVRHYFRRLVRVLFFYRYRFIWIEKEIFPYCPALVESLLSFLGVKYVVDYDDAIFHNYDLSKNFFVRFFLKKKIDRVMRGAFCVIAGNEYLAARARDAGAKRVMVIPTVVDAKRYSHEGKKRSKITIGWIGTPSTQKYVLSLLNELQALAEKVDFRLLLVGATSDFGEKFPRVDVIVNPWSESNEASLINQMDIGIMPLDDGAWERGKCGYKLIQYMASSIPVVASPVGVNKDIVTQAGAGFLAKSGEWEISLLHLIQNPSIRKECGNLGRQAVENRFSINSQVDRLERCFPGSSHE